MSLNLDNGYATGSFIGVSEVYDQAGSGGGTSFGAPSTEFSNPTSAFVPKTLDVIVKDGLLMSNGDDKDSGAQAGDYVDNRGSGTAWDNISAVFSSDDVYATVELGADGVSKELFLQGFNFNLPLDAELLGVQIEVERSLIRGEIISDIGSVAYCAFAASWNISTATLSGDTLSPSEPNTPTAFTISADGTKVYVVDSAGTESVYMYDLSTAWDLSTASYSGDSYSLAGVSDLSYGISFSPAGTDMFVLDASDKTVHQYVLSTAWDITTASYTSKLFVFTGGGLAKEVYIRADGIKMYEVDSTFDTVYQLTLSTPWDVSTATYDLVEFDFSVEEGNPASVFFKPDGTVMYMTGTSTDSLYEYSLTVPWDVSTAVYGGRFLYTKLIDSSMRGIRLNEDGTKLYMLGQSTDTVYQFDVG